MSIFFLDVGFAAAGGDTRIGRHPVHEDFEVARRQAQIEIQFAEIIVTVHIYRMVPRVKRLDDAWPDCPSPPIASGHDLDPVVLRLVFG